MISPCRKLTTTVLMLACLAPAARGQDDRAPSPPPVNPVSPGTSVDGQTPPVKLDADTLQAIRLIVMETVRSQSPAPSTQAPYLAPMPTPQGYAALAPAPAPVYQAPVTPVILLKEKGLFHKAAGHIGQKMARMGQPTVTQGYLQQNTSSVAYLPTQSTVPVPPPAPQMVPMPAQIIPMPSPQAPRK